MSPAKTNEKSASTKAEKLGGKEFEETFKPKKNPTEKDLVDKKDDKKGKKKKSGPRNVIVIFMIIVVLIAGAGAALYFSGNLTTVFALIGLTEEPIGMTLEEQQAALEQKKTELNTKEQALNELQAQLDAQQEALDSAKSTAQAEALANRTFEETRLSFSSEKLSELQQIGVIYSKMDPTAAAAIMTELFDTKQIAIIIYYMPPAAAALVMEKMDAGLAAGATEILTR